MSIEAQAGDLQKDGTITVKIDNEDIKFVKESDLGAVKGALKGKETEVGKLQEQIEAIKTKHDTAHQELLKERAAKDAAEKGVEESATLKTKVGELETELAGLKESSGGLQERLAGYIRNRLTEFYKVDVEKVKDMALADLEQTEKSLNLVGVPAAANYDKGGGGSGGGDENLTPLQKIEKGLKNRKIVDR